MGFEQVFSQYENLCHADDFYHDLNLEKAEAIAVSCLLPMIYQLAE